jgi:solute carrier family 25 S-adenosylmethionine transporter 26
VICNDLDPFPSKLIERIIISSIATLPQNSIKIPFEVIKQKMQTTGGQVSRDDVIKEIMSTQGFKGFFVGSNAQLLRELPYNAIQMSMFEFLQDLYVSAGLKGTNDAYMAAIGGLFASCFAALWTQPADVIKTKIMAGDNSDIISPTSGAPNIVHIVKEIYSKEGWRGFFVGFKPRLALVSLGGLVYFWAADVVEENYFSK